MRKTLIAALLAASLPTIALATPAGPHCQHSGPHAGMAAHGEHRDGLKGLQLSAEQRDKLAALMREQRGAPHAITRKYLDKLPAAERQAMRQEIDDSRAAHLKAVRALLTSEQQKTFDAQQAERDKRRAERAEFEAWKAEKAAKAQ